MSGGPQQLFNGGVRLDRVNDEEERKLQCFSERWVFKQGNGGKRNYFKE